jgi:hypothetical protein
MIFQRQRAVAKRRVPGGRAEAISYLKLLACAGLLVCALAPTHSAMADDEPRCCISETGAYNMQSPDLILQRFKLFQGLGVDIVRSSLVWEDMESTPGKWAGGRFLTYSQLAVQCGFKLKMNFNTLSGAPFWFYNAHPDIRMTNQAGIRSHHTLSFWYPKIHEVVAEVTDHMFKVLSEHPEIVAKLEFIDLDFGPASEPIYPAAWTLDKADEEASNETFWCYDVHAQADFRNKMTAKYGDIFRVNAEWNTKYKSWNEVVIPNPGTQPGPFWNDVLTWYRDSKRDFILWQIQNFKTAMAKYLPKPIKLILYVPGSHYTDKDWRQAVATGAGNGHIALMCDSIFLLETAKKEHCWLQYTGSSDEPEVKALREYMDAHGLGHIPLWGENAGITRVAIDPLQLADVVIKYNLFGLDYTHSRFVLKDDMVTPNEIFPKLKEAYAEIKQKCTIK